MKKLLSKILHRVVDYLDSHPGDWMENRIQMIKEAFSLSSPGGIDFKIDPDADKEFLEIGRRQILSPFYAFNESLRKGEVEVAEAYLFEGKFDMNGKLMRDEKLLTASGLGVPFRIRHVRGHDQFRAAVKESERIFSEFPEKVKKVLASKKEKIDGYKAMLESKMIEQSDFDLGIDGVRTQYDPLQYTEYAPTYAGPFNKQLYLYDYLTMHARAFEERNHNPVAKRIIDVLAQYSFGRRFKVKIKDEKKEKVWEAFEHAHNFIHRLSEFWVREYLLYGELMINKQTWQSIDPSTVWDIITDPDDINNVYYYYQSYPTAFQQFTGYQVPGSGGGQKAPPIQYIIRQIPYTQVLHIKGNVVSQEKRGRSVLFPVLGWLKRIKDLYNAEVLKQQLEACFIWDDTINGSEGDVQAHVSKFTSLPQPASVFAHNEQVKRQAMPALSGSGSRSGAGIGGEILALIATGIGMPKDFLNVISSGGMGGGGSRATALVGAEPFEKVIEDIQAKFENLLLTIAEEVIVDAGLDYQKGDVEFIFPSVTKDTTSETIKNIAMGQTMGYLSKETAADMYAGEMNITTYDYDAERERMAKEPQPSIMPPDGRFGMPQPGQNGNGSGNSVSDDETPIHGNGKVKLKKQMGDL